LEHAPPPAPPPAPAHEEALPAGEIAMSIIADRLKQPRTRAILGAAAAVIVLRRMGRRRRY
jgi:hypothetical protein